MTGGDRGQDGRVTAIRERYAAVFARGEGTDRIEFFSDAVFAIAMTLLVLEIRLPEVESPSELGPALLDLWPSYFAYALSFGIIALNWMSHHRKFRVIDRYDGALIRVNLLLLFVIAFVPFPTAVLAETAAETPVVILYAATVAAISLLQLALWVIARRHDLMSPVIDAGLFRFVLVGLLPVPVVFGASIVIALFSADAAMYSWIAIWPLTIVTGRVARARIR